jgi:hypothetical protein
LQVVAEAATLRQAREHRIEPLGVVLERAGCWRHGRRLVIGWHRLLAADRTTDRTTGAHPKLNKLPITA